MNKSHEKGIVENENVTVDPRLFKNHQNGSWKAKTLLYVFENNRSHALMVKKVIRKR